MIDIAELAVRISTNGSGAETAQELNEVESAGTKAGTSFAGVTAHAGRLEHQLVSLAARSAGANSELAAVTAGLVRLGEVGIAAAGVVAIIGLSYLAFTEDAREAKAQTDELIRHLDAMGSTTDKIDAATLHIKELRTELEKLADPNTFANKFKITMAAMAETFLPFIGDGIAKHILNGIENNITKTKDEIEEANKHLEDLQRDRELRALSIQEQQIRTTLRYGGVTEDVYKKENDQLVQLVGQQARLNALKAGATAAEAQQAAQAAVNAEFARQLEEATTFNERVQNDLRNPAQLLVPYSQLADALIEVDAAIVTAGEQHNQELLTQMEKRKQILLQEQSKLLNATKSFNTELQNDIVDGFKNAFNGQNIGQIIVTFAAQIIQQYARMQEQLTVQSKTYQAVNKATNEAAAATTAATEGATAAAVGTAGATAQAAAPLLTNPFTVGTGLAIIAAALAAVSTALGGSGGGSGGSSNGPTIPSSITTTTVFNPANTDRAAALDAAPPVAIHNPVFLGNIKNDPQVQAALAQTVQKASKRGYQVG